MRESAESRVKRRETKGIGVGKIAEGYERSGGEKNEMKKKEDAGDEDMRERERKGGESRG